MSPAAAETTGSKKMGTAEFWLVFAMLGVLTVLVMVVLLPELETELPNNLQPATAEQLLSHHRALLDYRKDVLAVILTAFGAWIGAGAAYFFGRENFKEAAQSLLQMRNASPAQKLVQTKVSEVPPRPIDWKVKTAAPLKDVVDKLRAEITRWFVPVVDDKGVLVDVLHREGVSAYLTHDVDKVKQTYDTAKVADLIAYLQLPANEPLRKQYAGIYVPVKRDTTVSEAHDEMQKKSVFIAVVTDVDGKPTEFIDTADVRRLLLTGS
jgi:hypothetical protein